MNIQIDKDYKLTSDANNFILEQRIEPSGKAKEDKVKWKQIGFYTSLDRALGGLRRRKLLDADITSFSELSGLLRDLTASIDAFGEAVQA